MNAAPTTTLNFEDAPEILRLNNAHAEETSPLDENTLRALLDTAIYARGIRQGAAAFLIALDQNGLYASPNFLWFKARYDSFVYIDRIVVDPAQRGQGLAKSLYKDLFAAARRIGHTRIVCEVNLVPPNPVSDNFHRALGFRKVGQAEIHGGLKTVCYLEKILD